MHRLLVRVGVCRFGLYTVARFSTLEMYMYFLVYWPEEESVSTVERDAISCPSGCDLSVGAKCEVAVRRQKYKGRIAAKGNRLFGICCNLFLMNKVVRIIECRTQVRIQVGYRDKVQSTKGKGYVHF